MEFTCAEGHKVIAPYKKIRDKFECPICKNNPYKNIQALIPPPAKKKGTTRLLALDQATQVSGWSLWDGDQLVKYGAFHAPSGKMISRLSQVHFWLLNLINNFQPDIVVLEDIQMQDKVNDETGAHYGSMGVTTYKSLAELLGVLSVCLYENNVDFKIVSSQIWRKGVGVKGRSRADRKRSAQQLVKQWYDINVTEDEADAICLGKYGVENCAMPKMIKWE